MTSYQGPITKDWFERAKRSLVNGVSSGFRYWGEEETIVIDHAEGAYLYDMDGTRYIDYQNGFGPVILGHGHPQVAAAVGEAAAAGTTFAITQRREIEAAETFLRLVPWADRLRFTNTGTEATMHAIRLVRAYTGRDIILKFEGQYHGMHDYVLFSTAGTPVGAMGSRRDPIPWQSSSGIPEVIRSTIKTLPFNDLEAAERAFRTHGHRIAGVIVEPMLGNAYAILPEDGFLAGLRALCDGHGTQLIFDEVKTGFRIAPGGANEVFGVVPDVGTFAKAMGNGFPVAAIAGRSHLMDAWGSGGIGQAGTYSGNAVSVAAAKTTMEIIEAGGLDPVVRQGTALMRGIASIIEETGVEGHVVGLPGMFSIFFGPKPTEFRDHAHHDAELYDNMAARMIAKGVFVCPDALEPWFPNASVSDEDVARTLEVFDEALTEELAGR